MMRAAGLAVLILLGGFAAGWASPDAAAQGSGCATLLPRPPSEPRSVQAGEVFSIDLRHQRPTSCVGSPTACPDSSNRVQFAKASGSAEVEVAFSPNPATVTASGGSMEARTRGTFSVSANARNSSYFQVRVQAGCGGHLASSDYEFVSPPLVKVNWTLTERQVDSGSTNWTVKFRNRGMMEAFIDFRPIPPTGYLWTGIGDTLVLGGSRPSVYATEESRRIGVNATFAKDRLGLELLIRPGSSGSVENQTLWLTQGAGLEGRAVLPSTAVAPILVAMAATLWLRKRPS